jgi:putative radical SAM enzyme (TIGR03279 family)
MNTRIARIYPQSIAEELQIEIGDRLLSINGTAIKDIIDYKFLMADEYIEIELEKEDGEVWSLEIEKEYDEDLGVEFENQIMDDARSCCNKCLFCFIDQLPKGMRQSLYFKDDDSRLSFLQGNFVTMTNMKDDDIDRIIRYRISPINISVHTTNPELRVKMLNNRFAGNIYDRLKKLAEAGISMNCQIVSCPGVNNGEELIRTVEDLYKLHPSVENVAVVPVGITKYREGLAKLELYNKQTAQLELDNVKKLQEKYEKAVGHPFVRLSDEFYITAEAKMPDSSFYGDYEQLEDGIGMIRLFRDSIENDLSGVRTEGRGSFTLVTGASAYKEIAEAAKKISSKNSAINLKVKKIINNYFGQTITVAGLLTGKDIIEQLSTEEVGNFVIIPKNMLKSGESIFLDDITIDDLERELYRKVLVCDYTGEDLIQIINDNLKEA